MKWLALLLMLLAVILLGQARWSATQRLRTIFVALAATLLVASCVVAGSPGPAIVIGGLALLVAARDGGTSRRALIGLGGIALIFVGAFVIRAAG